MLTLWLLPALVLQANALVDAQTPQATLRFTATGTSDYMIAVYFDGIKAECPEAVTAQSACALTVPAQLVNIVATGQNALSPSVERQIALEPEIYRINLAGSKGPTLSAFQYGAWVASSIVELVGCATGVGFAFFYILDTPKLLGPAAGGLALCGLGIAGVSYFRQPRGEAVSSPDTMTIDGRFGRVESTQSGRNKPGLAPMVSLVFDAPQAGIRTTLQPRMTFNWAF